MGLLRFLVLGSSLLAGCPSVPLNAPSVMAGYTVAGPAGTMLGPGTFSLSAVCPAGKLAVGGGWSSSTNLATQMSTSAPLPGGRGWTVTASNANPIIGLFLRPFAICVDPLAGYTITSPGGSLQSQEVKSFEAVCPSNTHVVTGGGISAASGEVIPFSQGIVGQPAPERYRAGGRSIALLPGSSGFAPLAICADFTQVPGREILLSPSVSAGPLSSASLQVDCPNNKVVLHGAVLSLDSGLRVIQSHPVNGGPSWTATIYNPILGAPMSGRLQVVCANAP
ncbi:hypothetical protein [Niveibacterium sp. SC-1]|uniref:hypothetical protein n=1 Tax=Niveibacterium sp. SC-1 TaxID=3135646 RepID=UPI00311D8D2D